MTSDISLTADSGVASLIMAWSETFVEIDHEIISMAILLPSTDSRRLGKYLNFEGFLEKLSKIKSALKSTGKSLKSLEKSLNSTIFCRT